MRNARGTSHVRDCHRVVRFAAVMCALIVLPAVWSSASGRPEGVVHARDGVAIDGYDTVGYFTLNEAVRGKPEFAADWNGVTWWFRSLDHLERFLDAPEQYAPRYGGYCAQAAANGDVTRSDPTVWSIVEGQLYLNCGIRIQRRFRNNVDNAIEAANSVVAFSPTDFVTAGGVGLRFAVDPEQRLNLRIDFAHNGDSLEVYVDFQEAF